MKKSILVILIAVSMLFAFTACEQSAFQYPANVDYITVVQTKDFVDGDAFSASNFTVYAHDTNGGNNPVAGAKVELTGTNSTDSKLSASKSYTVQATLNVATSDTALTADCSVEVAALESYAITGAPSLVAYVGKGDDDNTAVFAVPASGTIDPNAITVSAVYENGETRSVKATDFLGKKLYVTDSEGNKIEDEAFVVDTTYYISVGTGESAILTNLTATAVAEAPSDNFVRYEYKVTSKGYYGETLGWTIYEVSEQDKSEADWTPVATSENWSTTTKNDWIVMSYSAGDSDPKDDGLNMPTQYTANDQVITLRNIANASRPAVTMRFDAGKNGITSQVDADDIVPNAKLEKLTSSLQKSDIQIKIDRLIPVYGEGTQSSTAQQQYLPEGNYSIEKQSLSEDGKTWTGVVKVTYTYLNTTGYVESTYDKLIEVSIADTDLTTE